MKWNQVFVIVAAILLGNFFQIQEAMTSSNCILVHIDRTNTALWQIQKELKTCQYQSNDMKAKINDIEIQAMKLNAEAMQIKFKMK